MVASGRVDVKPLITHNYKLEETLQAFERAKSGEGGAIKVCVCVHGNVCVCCMWYAVGGVLSSQIGVLTPVCLPLNILFTTAIAVGHDPLWRW